MKLMLSLFLLVAICHAAEASRSRREDEDMAAVKRLLQEGNFGMKIQPSLEIPFPNPQSGYDANNNELREGPPQKEYGLPAQEYGTPRQPAKISDVLTGQGAFPAAIHSHLYSPVQVYRPRLGSPTTFEVSQPVPSQLMYSEHKIYQAAPNIQTSTENPQALSLSTPPQLPSQPQQSLQVNPFPGFSQLQPLQPRPALPKDFLPRVDIPRPPPRPDFPQQIYQHVFSQQSGSIPQDIYQQINQLGNQINYDEAIQGSQSTEQKENNESGNVEQQESQNAGLQYANQGQRSEQQGQKIDEQRRESEQQSTQRPQAVSYASFSQSIPASQNLYQYQQLQVQSSPLPPQQRQQLPQPHSPPLFQPLQSTPQSTVSPIGTSPSQSTIYRTFNQTPRPIGLVSQTPGLHGEINNQEQETTTAQTFTVSTIELQGSSTSTVVTTDDKIRPQSTTTQQQTTRARFFTPVPLQSRQTLRPFTRPTFAPRSTQSTLQALRTFPSRQTLPPLSALNKRQQTTSQTFSTLPSSTLPQQSVSVQSLPTLSSQPETQSISTLPPQPSIQTISTIPPQTSFQTISTFPPTTPQPQGIQSTLAPIPLFQPQQIQPVSFLPQFPSTLNPLPQLTTISPLPIIQPLPTLLQPNVPRTPFQRYEVQSELQPIIQIQDYKSEENSQQQLSQQLQQPQFPLPQLSINRESQQIQQQLQAIQQQLQFLQQQPAFIQQQPQPLHIGQQQTSPFPQPIQLVQQQQPVQLVQQPPQPSSKPQLQSEQLIQQQPQPTPIPQLQPLQFIQQQPQPSPAPQLQPVQLIQQQPQPSPIPQLQPVQIIQQQPQPSPAPQLQPVQLIQQQTQPSPAPQLQPQLIKKEPELIQTHPPPIQSIQLQPKPSPQAQIQQQSQQEKENQNNSQIENKSENHVTIVPKEDEAFYNQLASLQNHLYTEELLIQQPQLLPVPVGFPSYPATSPILSPIHSAHLHSPHLHSPHLHSSHLHTPYLHSPSLHDHSYHSTHSFPSTQFYGKHPTGIFGGWK